MLKFIALELDCEFTIKPATDNPSPRCQIYILHGIFDEATVNEKIRKYVEKMVLCPRCESIAGFVGLKKKIENFFSTLKKLGKTSSLNEHAMNAVERVVVERLDSIWILEWWSLWWTSEKGCMKQNRVLRSWS